MKKKLLRFTGAFVLILASVIILTKNASPISIVSFAEKSLEENKNEVKKLEDTLDSAKDEISILENQIKAAKENVEQQSQVKYLLDQQIEKTKEEIEISEKLIVSYNKQIALKEIEIEQINADIDDLVDLISDRLIIEHETLSTKPLSFILSSKDFSELLSRMEFVKQFFEHDQENINKLNSDLAVLEAAKEELELVKQKCEDTKSEMESKKNELEPLAQEALDVLNTLKSNESFLEQAKAAKEQELIDIQNEIKELNNKIQLQEREDYSNQEFRFPLPYDAYFYCSGGFGWRYWDNGRQTDYHRGVDLAAYYGTDIIAANSGVVTISRLSPSFGNYVVIDHGGGISSLYAHASARLVSVGDVVQKGDVIAKVGSTGDSTGNHLHFSILKNGEYVDPLDYIKIP